MQTIAIDQPACETLPDVKKRVAVVQELLRCRWGHRLNRRGHFCLCADDQMRSCESAQDACATTRPSIAGTSHLHAPPPALPMTTSQHQYWVEPPADEAHMYMFTGPGQATIIHPLRASFLKPRLAGWRPTMLQAWRGSRTHDSTPRGSRPPAELLPTASASIPACTALHAQQGRGTCTHIDSPMKPPSTLVTWV
jgi:hypothetical protein